MWDRWTLTRLQRFRNWKRWRAAVKHSDVFENSAIRSLLKQPSLIKESQAWTDVDQFQQLCGLIADLASETNGLDSLAFVDVFVAAERHFGERALRNNEGYRGYGPQDALIAVIRHDRSQAPRAVERLIESGSVWLSNHLVWTVHGDAFGTSARPSLQVSHRLVDDEDRVRALTEQWRGKAMDWLNRASEPKVGQSAFDLAGCVQMVGGDPVALRAVLTNILEDRPRGLEICFSREEYSGNKIAISQEWMRLLPDPALLSSALSKSPGFEANHPRLLEIWRSSATPASG